MELLCAPVMAAPRYGGRPVYFTDVVVRRDHPARAFADLRGAAWAYNDDGSHSGYNVVRHHLLALGETRGYFGRVVASGAHQTSIQMVLDGEVDASGHRQHGAGARDGPPAGARGGPSDGRRDRAEPHAPGGRGTRAGRRRSGRASETLFLTMPADTAGRAILAEGRMTGFVPVRDADYDPIRAMVRRAEAAGLPHAPLTGADRPQLRSFASYGYVQRSSQPDAVTTTWSSSLTPNGAPTLPA